MRPKIIKIDSGTKQTKDKKPPEKIERIKGYDYKAWDKFDVVSKPYTFISLGITVHF